MKHLKQLSSIATSLCLGFFAFSASAGNFDISGPAGNNVDTFPASTFQITVVGPGTITDLNFAIHLYNSRTGVDFPGTMAWGDLDVMLSKDGVDVKLWMAGNPGETSDLFVVLDDRSTERKSLNDVLAAAGPDPAPTQAPKAFASGIASPVGLVGKRRNIAASYSPLGSLSDFNGLDLAGQWTLTIVDNAVPDEGDMLLGWQIFGNTEK